MAEKKLAGLEPASVLSYFEEICAIPHGSRNTKAISDYLVSFAKAHGLKYIQDEVNNVILFGPGTQGLEDHAPVILQGHMDMVCEKDPDCTLDMVKDPLDLTHDDQFVFARGTTLGGDDGIAVAYAIGMTKGMTATTFAPDKSATRAQAAAMLVRIYEKLQTAGKGESHGFYAISSYSQIQLAEGMDSVSFGWSRMTWADGNAKLATTSAHSRRGPSCRT